MCGVGWGGVGCLMGLEWVVCGLGFGQTIRGAGKEKGGQVWDTLDLVCAHSGV